MRDYRLLVSQKNKVFEILSTRPFDLTRFEWVEIEMNYPRGTIDKGMVSQIRHPGDYFFTFDRIPSNHRFRSTFSPGEDERIKEEFVDTASEQLRHVELWAGYLEREITQPDMWEVIGTEKFLAGAAAETDTENSPFTQAEVSQVAQNLTEIKEYLIATSDFGPEQARYIEERFAYLLDASRRLGKKDWLTLLYGGLINVIVGLALAGDRAGEVLRFAGQVFHWLTTVQHFFPLSGT